MGEALRDLARQRRVLRRGRQFRKRVTSLYEDSTGNLFAGAVTGLWRWKPVLRNSTYADRPLELESDNGALLISTVVESDVSLTEKPTRISFQAGGEVHACQGCSVIAMWSVDGTNGQGS